ncbi:50S ribosomal protein L25/general stress protein Ctc [Phenylobacterium sp.]|uniref:50S ribosomal protein L25/general stress protein Ctc n=1 Tax=Phenylobacterium sp. TaxID=1871053 RepID=UPI002E2F2B7D|nr:50S ribosomal protein L25/general stress protein Ctc [Phenylobacterium sp.]HEX3363832.1 50S ribosomal protein L25/general stress protein Ctc [Phenylobacterium sp.]
MADIVLNVEVRERTGTGGARVARREGLVPGVLYGGDKDPVAISVKMNEFKKALYTGKLLGHLVTLKYGSETQPVIAKAVDMHPVTDTPWHFDLYRVDAHQQIKIEVPLHFQNHEASPGLKRGGTLNVALHEVELMVPADQIPEALVIDLTGLDIGDSVRSGALTLPKGAKLSAHDRDAVVASVATSSAMQSGEAAEEETPDAAS